jgi:4-aminobutyrate aminotransferase-like enzyme
LSQRTSSTSSSHGLGSPRSNLIAIAPPLCITRAELEEGLQAVNKALDVADQMLPNP